jgi:ATP-dependent helicase/nuclease subunit A
VTKRTPDDRITRLRAGDEAAHRAALTVFDRPVVLEAGAGTGKTAALVGRILAWSLRSGWERAEKQDPTRKKEEIAADVFKGVVAITFTEAAAAEMATRVGEGLAKLAAGTLAEWLPPDVLPADATVRCERARALLVALDHLVVCTIHAFCRRILARAPLEAGLHPAFTVDADEVVLGEVVEAAVEEGLRQGLGEPADDHLLYLIRNGHGPDALVEAVIALLRAGVPARVLENDPFSRDAVAALGEDLAGAVGALVATLAPRVRAARRSKNASAVADALAELERMCSGARGPELLDHLRSDVKRLLPENLADHLDGWRKEKFGQEERTLLAGVESEIGEGAARVLALRRHLLSLDPELLTHARCVLAPMLAQVERELLARGAVTFGGLLSATAKLLQQPEAAGRERREIRQLLVDEFQDTDRRQCAILHALALDGAEDKRPGLFIVGDPQQSIYGWRDADLEAYENFIGTVTKAGGERHVLSVNFRSAPPILEEIARCLGPVMRAEAGVRVAFQELVPCEKKARETGFRLGRWAAVELWDASAALENAGATKEPVGDVTEREAHALGQDIRALHDEGGVAWGEIGILLRAATDLDDYLQELRAAEVPYVVEGDRSYFQRREVIEAAALLRTVLDPADQLALVSWLRSVVVGVPDAALLPLWQHGFPELMLELAGPDPDRLERLRAAITRAAAEMPADVPGLARIPGWEQIVRASVGRIAELRASFEQEPAARFVERLRTSTLIEATAAARALGAYRVANLDRFFRTVRASMDARGSDAQALLRALRASVSEEREAEEARPRGAVEDAVRVMTIHKAKGLDFAHVYLVQAGRTTRTHANVSSEAVACGAGFEYRLVGAPTPGWERIVRRREQVAAAELERTLYVAMTRAKERLVVSGAWGERVRGAGKGSHTHLLAHRMPDGGTELYALAQAAHVNFVDRDDVRVVFPALTPAALGPRQRKAARLPDADTVARSSAALAAERERAARRMLRPFAAVASGETRELSPVRQAGDAPDVADEAVPERSLAAAVGTAFHRVMERLDLARDLGAQLAQQRARVAQEVGGEMTPKERAALVAETDALLAAFAASPLYTRLARIAPHVIARELPVLLPPAEGEGAPVGFVSGAADLLYRDPADGGFVVADFKTGAVTDAKLGAAAAAFAAQGQAYAGAVQDALGLPVRPRFELWFVRVGRSVTVVC